MYIYIYIYYIYIYYIHTHTHTHTYYIHGHTRTHTYIYMSYMYIYLCIYTHMYPCDRTHGAGFWGKWTSIHKLQLPLFAEAGRGVTTPNDEPSACPCNGCTLQRSMGCPTCIYIHINIYIYTHVYAYIYIYMYVCMYVCIYIYTFKWSFPFSQIAGKRNLELWDGHRFIKRGL